MEDRNRNIKKGNKTTKNNAVAVRKVRTVEAGTAGRSLERRPTHNGRVMHAVRAPRIINVKKKDKTPFPWSIVFTALILTSMFLFMMMNYAEVDKYRSEITELDNKITTMTKTQTDLEVKLSNKYDLDEIRNYAENELGMVKKETLRSQYISIGQDDKSEMKSYDDGEEGGFGYLLTGLGEVIRDFIK